VKEEERNRKHLPFFFFFFFLKSEIDVAIYRILELDAMPEGKPPRVFEGVSNPWPSFLRKIEMVWGPAYLYLGVFYCEWRAGVRIR